MPNWCNNKLVISGSAEAIEHFKKTLGPKGEFKFTQTVPMPRELQEVTTGHNIINGKHYDQWREEILTPPRVKARKARKAAIAKYRAKVERNGGSKRVMIPVTETDKERLMRQYGAPDWYNWAQANWGTKWDIDSDTTMEELGSQDGYAALVSTFDTAWTPPINWAKAAGKKFPELTFEIHYSESGMGYYGTFTVTDEEFNDDYHEGMFQKDINWNVIDNKADALTPEAKAFHDDHGLDVNSSG